MCFLMGKEKRDQLLQNIFAKIIVMLVSKLALTSDKNVFGYISP